MTEAGVSAAAVATVVERVEAEPSPDRRAAGDAVGRGGYVAAVVLVVLIAAVLRAIALPSALPYTVYVDEGYVLRPAAHMVADRTWDPDWYGYPSLLIELTAGDTAAYDLVAADVRTVAEESDATENYNEVGPQSLVVASRLVVWLLAVGTVLVTMPLASRLVGRMTAIVAGLLVAVTPALVSRSAIAIVDTPATFFVMASVLGASMIPRARRPLRVAAAAGALAGLAATSKYPSAAVIVVSLTVIALVPTFGVRQKATLATAAVASAIVASVVTMPALVLRPGAVTDAISEQSRVYGRSASRTGYLQQLVESAEVGWWLAVPAVVGVGLLCWIPRSRRVTIGWLLFVAVLAVAVSRSQFQPFRNLLPVVPFLAVATATTIVEVGRLIADLVVGRLRRAVTPALVAGMTAATTAALYVGGVQPYLDTQATVTDSRTRAVDWLAEEVQPDQRVLVASELVVAASDLERIPGDVVEVETAEGDVMRAAEEFDFLVTGDFEAAGGLPAPPAPPADLRVLARFGRAKPLNAPNLWRGVDQIVEIRRGEAG